MKLICDLCFAFVSQRSSQLQHMKRALVPYAIRKRPRSDCASMQSDQCLLFSLIHYKGFTDFAIRQQRPCSDCLEKYTVLSGYFAHFCGKDFFLTLHHKFTIFISNTGSSHCLSQAKQKTLTV